MNFDIVNSTYFLTVYGSHAYGFSTPTSDWDYRGVCIPDLNTYLGINNTFQQADSKDLWKLFPKSTFKVDPELSNPDMQITALVKFAQLAAHGNPSVLEILFTDEELHVISKPEFRVMLDNKELFLSQRVRYSFSGYAISQLKRIKTHRAWLLNPPTKKPTRAEFGLPDNKIDLDNRIGAAAAIIQKNIKEIDVSDILSKDMQHKYKESIKAVVESVWGVLGNGELPIGENKSFKDHEDVLFFAAAKDYGFSDNMLEMLARERKYKEAKSNWDSYNNWKSSRNPARAELEAKFGYDTKHAVHLVRLIRMCKELIGSCKLIVTRPDADELMAIRNGEWSFDKLLDYADNIDNELNELMKTTKLPKTPNLKRINELVVELNCSLIDPTV